MNGDNSIIARLGGTIDAGKDPSLPPTKVNATYKGTTDFGIYISAVSSFDHDGGQGDQATCTESLPNTISKSVVDEVGGQSLFRVLSLDRVQPEASTVDLYIILK